MSEPAYISATIWETTLIAWIFLRSFYRTQVQSYWLPLSLINSCLVDLIVLALACEGATSKLEVVREPVKNYLLDFFR